MRRCAHPAARVPSIYLTKWPNNDNRARGCALGRARATGIGAPKSRPSKAECNSAAKFGTSRDPVIAAGSGRHISRQVRLAYLAPEVLKQLVFGREVAAVTVMQLSECVELPAPDHAGVPFGEA